MTPRWSPFHLRLHRLLLQRPALLPQGTPLLLAVSGGQDSMALTGLLLDLVRLHGWTLHLWHGDHGWREESAQQAAELTAWAQDQGLSIHVARWNPAVQNNGDAQRTQTSEAQAREWRYSCLAREAERLGTGRVVTGHTASDRAETLLLHLARGSHRRGLAGMPIERELAPGIQLVRPLLGFSRAETATICTELGLPIWDDSSNADPRFSRNRVRHEVMPVLEALHPGASRRLAATAERLEAEEGAATELITLALRGLQAQVSDGDAALRRQELVAQSSANQRRLLQHWCRSHTGQPLPSRQLELLLQRLAKGQPPGVMHLAAGWQLRWDRSTLHLQQR